MTMLTLTTAGATRPRCETTLPRGSSPTIISFLMASRTQQQNSMVWVSKSGSIATQAISPVAGMPDLSVMKQWTREHGRNGASIVCLGFQRFKTPHKVTRADVKYDNCNVPATWNDEYRWWPENWNGGPPNEDQSAGGSGESNAVPAPSGYDWATSNTFKRYKIMSDALLATNRTIEYSQCAWGHGHVDEWGNLTGHSWRMWGDIYPTWSGKHEGSWGIMPILNHASFFHNSTNFWGHADWDMLEVGNGNLTIDENRSHFAMWAALKSPLIIGTPLDTIKPDILEILSNKDLIAFNQDPVFGAPATPYKWGINPDGTWNQSHPAEYWSGESSLGTYVFVLNTLESAQNKTIEFSEVPGLQQGKKYTLYDSWSGSQLGAFTDRYKALVRPHDTAVVRFV